jgi:hypothetical protein
VCAIVPLFAQTGVITAMLVESNACCRNKKRC